jgi:hypothetical protein
VLAVLLGMAGTAHAAIYWDHIQVVNQANQQCLAGQGQVADNSLEYFVPGCMHDGNGWIWLTSGQPDSNGDANVLISTYDYQNQWVCLSASPGYDRTWWDTCNSNNPNQIWTMITAASPQNVGNPAGLKHFIVFFNVVNHRCLTGGNGVWVGVAGPCSGSDWQVWNIYTNQGSS